jgi:hypothetical protein
MVHAKRLVAVALPLCPPFNISLIERQQFDEWKPSSAMARAKNLVEDYERRMASAALHRTSAMPKTTTVIPVKRGRGRPRKASER